MLMAASIQRRELSEEYVEQNLQEQIKRIGLELNERREGLVFGQENRKSIKSDESYDRIE